MSQKLYFTYRNIFYAHCPFHRLQIQDPVYQQHGKTVRQNLFDFSNIQCNSHYLPSLYAIICFANCEL